MAESKDPLVLLVDDEKMLLDLYSSWLSAAGLKSIAASSGREAIDKFRRTSFDAVVLDLCLGDDPDGLEVLDAMKRENLHVPVIMMSGTVRTDVRKHAIRRGAYAFLAKPFGPESLLCLIRSAMLRNGH